MLPTFASARRRAARSAVLAALPLAALGLGAQASVAAPISLVKAINTSTGDSTPTPVVSLGGKGYFLASASGGTHDASQDDLYVTDGTSAGTSVFATLPKPVAAEQPEGMVLAGSTIYFTHVSTAGAEPELWSSDGTVPGTHAVRGLTVSSGTDVHGFTVAAASGTDLYFTGTSAQNPLLPAVPDTTLYRLHQGSSAAQVIAHISSGTIGNVTPVSGGTVFFTEDAGDGIGHQLWRTDGVDATTAHTVQLSATAPFGLVAVGSRLYFQDASAGASGDATQLWTSDGTTTAAIDFGSGADAPAGIGRVVATGNALYLTGAGGTDPTSSAQQPIWRVQGTTATAVTDGTALSSAQLLGAAGNTLLFTASASTASNIYALSGTTATPIHALGTTDAVSSLGTDGTALYLSINGTALWSTTGTTPVLLSSSYHEIDNTPTGPSFSKVGSTTYFDNRSDAEGTELWATGGSEATTRRVKDINGQPQDAKIQFTVSMGGKAYFTATDGAGGDQLWSTDGTTTTKVSGLVPPSGGTSIVRSMVATAHAIAIVTTNGMWWSNGTSARFVTPSAGADLGFYPIDPVVFGDQVAFDGPDAAQDGGYALWLTDGTDAGTHRVVDILGDPADSDPATSPFEPIYTTAGTQLYFLGWDATHGYELWHSDGTAAGTGLVRDIVPGTRSTTYATAAAVGDHLVFDATDADGIERMWKTKADGTGATLLTSAAFAVPASFIVGVGSDVFFAVNNQLWRVDGQAALCPFVPASRLILSMVPFGNGVAYLDMSGALTVSGGTADTTSVIHQFVAGAPGIPIFATASGLWFPEVDAATANGTELWHSDGTSAGTTLVADLATGGPSSSPHAFGVAGTSLVMAADAGTIGEQLYGTALGAPVNGPTGALPPCTAPQSTPIPTAAPTPVPTPAVGLAPAPTPTPAPIAKVTPTSMTAKVAHATDKKSPYLYAFSGLIALPKGADPRVSCIGSVLVQVKRGKKLVTSKSVALTVSGASCAYQVTVKLPKKAVKKPASGALTATLSFAGSVRLGAAKNPKAITLRYGD